MPHSALRLKPYSDTSPHSPALCTIYKYYHALTKDVNVSPRQISSKNPHCLTHHLQRIVQSSSRPEVSPRVAAPIVKPIKTHHCAHVSG